MSSSLPAFMPRLVRLATPAAPDTDPVLLDRFLGEHDEQAFALLMRRHGPMVLGVGCRLLGDRDAAEDVFQATFLVLARQAAKVRQRGSLAAWLYCVARRLGPRPRPASVQRASSGRDRRRRCVSEARSPPGGAAWPGGSRSRREGASPRRRASGASNGRARARRRCGVGRRPLALSASR